MATLVIHPGEHLRCDVCNALDPKFDYDTGKDIVLEAWIESGPKLTPSMVFSRLWALCDQCSAFVERKDFTGLRDRGLAIACTVWPSEAARQEQRKMMVEVYRTMERCGMTPCFCCDVCHMVSYHPEDIRHRYCGNCHEFR